MVAAPIPASQSELGIPAGLAHGLAGLYGGDPAPELPAPLAFTPGAVQTEIGIQINGCDRDVPSTLALARSVGFGWIKQQVRWGDIELQPGRIDWACLDRVIPAAHAAGFKLLASVTTAPRWARPFAMDTLGPPGEHQAFANFLWALVWRYPGQIQAIEIWNEANVDAEWRDPLAGAIYPVRYAGYLAAGYVAVKTADPSILVISAAPVPFAAPGQTTRYVDDATWLTQLFDDYGAARYVDCIGAHANGPSGVGDLAQLVAKYSQLTGSAKPICVTEFGYGLPVAGQAPKGFEWVMRNTEVGQVRTLTSGVRWARTSGQTRLVIVWNLNYDGAPSDPNAPYALARAGWVSPALDAMRLILAQDSR